MTDAFSTLFGGPSQEELLGQVRLEVWNSFEQVDKMFEVVGDNLTNPEFLKGFLRGIVLRVVAEANISDIIANEPSGGFATLYPKREAISIVREELTRAIQGGQDG